MKVDTNFDTNNGFIALKTYNFKVKIRSHLDKKTAIKSIQVNLGCYGEAFLQYGIKRILPAGVKAWSYDGAILKFKGTQVAQSEASSDVYLTTVSLNYVFDWTSDIATCGLGKLTLYTDSALSTLASGSANLVANPTTTTSQGFITPILAIDGRTPFNMMVWFKGENLGLTTQTSFKALVFICGQEQYVINATHTIFDTRVFRNASVVANPKLTFNLTEVIYSQSVQTWVLASDCPVDHYKVTTDSSCNSPVSDLTKFKVTGNLLEVGVATPAAQITVYICAFNSIEFPSLTKSKAMLLEICGYETVSVVSATALSYEYDMTTQKDLVSIPLAALFTSSASTCPVTHYRLVTNTGVPYS